MMIVKDGNEVWNAGDGIKNQHPSTFACERLQSPMILIAKPLLVRRVV